MSRKLLILWAGRRERREWEALYDRYRKRIARFMPIEEHAVKVRRSDEGQRRRAEGRELLAALPDPCWTVALDSRGESISSKALARRLARRKVEWPHPTAFLIGSDLGLDPSVRQSAREVLSFGPMTLAHELARLVLYEQLYRALSINAGINYHRDSF